MSDRPRVPYYEAILKDGAIVECIDVIRSRSTPEEFAGYCRGNILKYWWRAGYKPGSPLASDAAKCEMYCRWWREAEEAMAAKNKPQEPTTPAVQVYADGRPQCSGCGGALSFDLDDYQWYCQRGCRQSSEDQ